jgi:hypothetical protein
MIMIVGADLKLKDNDGKSPIEYAESTLSHHERNIGRNTANNGHDLESNIPGGNLIEDDGGCYSSIIGRNTHVISVDDFSKDFSSKVHDDQNMLDLQSSSKKKNNVTLNELRKDRIMSRRNREKFSQRNFFRSLAFFFTIPHIIGMFLFFMRYFCHWHSRRYVRHFYLPVLSSQESNTTSYTCSFCYGILGLALFEQPWTSAED